MHSRLKRQVPIGNLFTSIKLHTIQISQLKTRQSNFFKYMCVIIPSFQKLYRVPQRIAELFLIVVHFYLLKKWRKSFFEYSKDVKAKTENLNKIKMTE